MERILELTLGEKVKLVEAYDCDLCQPILDIYDYDSEMLITEVIGEGIPSTIDDKDFDMDRFVEHIEDIINEREGILWD